MLKVERITPRAPTSLSCVCQPASSGMLQRWLFATSVHVFSQHHVSLCRDLGNEAYLAVHFESAVHYFSVGLVLNPNDTVLLNNRSKTLFDLGDLKR